MALLAVFAAVNLVDFIFYGWHLYNLAALLGFALMALGILKAGKGVLWVGMALAVVAIAARHL